MEEIVRQCNVVDDVPSPVSIMIGRGSTAVHEVDEQPYLQRFTFCV